MAHYRRALEPKPDYVGAANNLAWTLATNPDDSVRNGQQAIAFAERANQLSRRCNSQTISHAANKKAGSTARTEFGKVFRFQLLCSATLNK